MLLRRAAVVAASAATAAAIAGPLWYACLLVRLQQLHKLQPQLQQLQ